MSKKKKQENVEKEYRKKLKEKKAKQVYCGRYLPVFVFDSGCVHHGLPNYLCCQCSAEAFG